MERDEIKRMFEWIQKRITLADGTGGVKIDFDIPKAEDFGNAGFGAEAVTLTLEAHWWEDMVADVIETPDFAEPDDSPEQVLQYARDVVSEYIRKRLYT
ncbi:MAG: hypothetical protein ACYS8W_00145 [Planctomycetota bacterium]|jgi:hypothetical protein